MFHTLKLNIHVCISLVTFLSQEVAIRSFILTNVEAKPDGGYGWNVNVDAIGKNADPIFGFPEFDSTYDGETLFIGGSLSQHFR